MFVGKPVIGARSGATAELIQDGVNGLLYNQGDPSDLAAKIEYLYKNPGIANELGRNGQSWVEKCFTQERYAGELIAVLKSLSLPIAKVIGPAPAV
jgi:glycosyltransferase involved in cell wall biosynthesis